LKNEQVPRRLAAILAADVAGYSRLMTADEEGTLARLKAMRRDVVDPLVAEHRGRIVKSTGDGWLAEFASVVDAVRCATGIQRKVASREAGAPEAERMLLRMGVNLGDVLADDGDIYGDGVNVAARLEALAEPGGIRISRAVRDHVRDRIAEPLTDLGEIAVKNIARPVRVFRIELGDAGAAAAPPQARVAPGISRRILPVALGLAVAAGGAAAGWWAWRSGPGSEAPAQSEAAATRRLSIVVLPFANLSGDAEQEWFADGLTEDLITDLSRISGAFVIARNTSFTFKGQAVDVRRVAADLGVRYVLEGSVRRAGGQVRVNAQLIDAATGAHVWAERFDRTAADVFALQSEVTGRIARALNLELLEAESRRSGPAAAGGEDAHELAVRGWVELLNKPQTRATNEAAQALVDRALALDPNSALAWTAQTYIHTRAASFGWTQARDETLRAAVEAGERAAQLDPKSSDAVYMLGYALRTGGRNERSMQAMEQAIALNANNPLPYHGLAYSSILLGKPAEALPLLDKAFKLSPREPLGAVWHWTAGFAHFLLGDDAAAAAAARKAIAINRNFPLSHWLLAAASAALGRSEEAGAAIGEYQKMHGGYDTVAKVHDRMADLSADAAYRKLLERLPPLLRKAGLPD